MLPSDIRDKMEKNVDEKLNSLEKYVPFINYLLHLDEDKYKKFKDIQHWIVSRKRYPMNVLQKIEQSIITQYRNLFYDDGICSFWKIIVALNLLLKLLSYCENRPYYGVFYKKNCLKNKVPKHIMDIFNTHAHAKCFRVNLCSDDEDNAESSSDIEEFDDDVIIVSTSPQDKVQSQAETAKQCGKLQEKSSISQCDKSKEQETASKPVLDPCITDEPICIDSDDDEDEVQNSTVPVEEELCVTEKQLFKRRRDFIDNVEEKDESRAIEKETYKNQQNELNKEKGNPNEVVELQKEELDFENMDIDQLKQIYEDLTKECGIDVDQLLKSITQSTDLENNKNKSPHDDFASSPIYPNSCVPVNPYPEAYANIMQPNVYTMPPQATLRLNLKDPRIIKLLERSNTLHMISMGTPVRNVTQSAALPIPEPTTYGEYKRLKAEQAKKAELKKLEEARKAELKSADELKRLNEAEELKRIEEEKRTEELRKIGEAKRAEELKIIEKAKKAEELIKIEGAKKAEELKRKEEAKRTEKLKREEEAKRAHELKRIEIAKRADEVKIIEESKISEDLRNREEAKKIEKLRRMEEAKRTKNRKELWKNNQKNKITEAEDTRITDKTKREVYAEKAGLVRTSKDNQTNLKTKINNLDNNTALSKENEAPYQSTEISSSTYVSNEEETDLRSIILNTILPYGDKILNVLGKGNQLQELNDKLTTLENSKKVTEQINATNASSVSHQISSVASTAVNRSDHNTKTVNNARNEHRREERTQSVLNFKKSQKSKKRPRKEKEPKAKPTYKRIRSISSSSSTTSESSSMSSTTSLPLTKRRRESQTLVKEPIVKLRRLSPETIFKYMKIPLASECKTINIRLVEDVKRTEKTVHHLVKEKPKKLNIKYKNIEKLMLNDNTTFCVLCKSKPSDLTNHYKRVHKTESYVARLSRSTLHYLENNVPFAQKLPKVAKLQKYSVKCAFCEDKIEDKFINFYKHFSKHTGEYAFQCDNCKLEKPYEFDIQSHKCHAKSCRNAAIRTLYQYPPNVLAIYLYCCKICNFVQLNEANTFKHLRDHHEKRQDDSSCIKRYILTAIKDEETCGKSPESDTKYELLMKDADEDILVKNEAILEEGITDFHKDEKEKVEANGSTLLLDRRPAFESALSTGLAMIELPYTNYTKYSSILNTNLISPNSAQQNDIQPIVLSTLENLKIASVSSSFDYIKTECSDTLPIQKENYSCKKVLQNSSNISYRQYPSGASYFGLYKCMATDCLFSTDAKEEILQHLKEHLSSECPPEGCLLCAYCQLDAEICTTHEMLIEHIEKNHQQSQFQCSVCCYRGISPSHVSLHFKHGHPEQEFQIVYQCALDIALDTSIPTNISELLKENVIPLVCPLNDCTRNFQSVIWMKNHLMHAHSLPIKSDCIAALEKYTCIYCTMNFCDLEMVRNHLVMCHPDKQPYVCERVLLPEKEEDLLQNLTITFVSLPIIPVESIRYVKMKPEFGLNSTNDMSGTEITDISGNITDVPAANQIECDTKPNLEQLVKTAEESVKASLQKLVTSTGISPNLLYHCPEPTCGGFFSTYDLWHRHMSLRHCCVLSICPHCVNNKKTELPLVDFKEHFQQHCCHLYGCFHCGETFSNEQASRDHITLAHIDINPNTSAIHLEKVPLYFNQSFNILLKSEEKKERYTLLLELQEVVQNRYKYIDKLINDSLKTQWIVPYTATWLENFPSFKSNERFKRKCFCQNCPFQTYDNEIFYAHLRETHQVKNSKFACAKCHFNVSCESWEPIIDHIKMHVLNIHICSVCSYYHHNRQKIRQHLTQEHRFRDVPIVTIIRSSVNTQISLAVVFAEQRKTFSTIKRCFCCDKSSNSWQAYVSHLKKAHFLTLQYFCEICDESLKLTECDAHFTNCHSTASLRIRCQIATNTQISIDSIMPLKLAIEPKSSDPLGVVKVIKQEPCDMDTESDSDIELITEDDIVIANDVNMCESQQNPKDIRCVNFRNLQSQHTNIGNFDVLHVLPQPLVPGAVRIPQMQQQLQLQSQFIPQYVPPASPIIAMNAKNASLAVPRMAMHSQNLNFAGDCNYRCIKILANTTDNTLNNNCSLQNIQR
ncbi:uncharacterized protein LOC105217408 isoform X2 [Zeugodacus cucurbitae]|nr:uncharacterized protein LOC105217408 isoform X2 [Zeugodacus cucurbitae]